MPIKAFADAKLRLAAALDAAQRAALAEVMAGRVLAAADGLPVLVVCDDESVARWAHHRGVRVMRQPGQGLNGAVEAGVNHLAAAGVQRVIVAHADLPLAERLGDLDVGRGVTLVPDRRDDGTNVACVPAAGGFRFSYGPGSFQRHCAEAARLGAELYVVRDPRLALDVDVPDDLSLLASRSR